MSALRRVQLKFDATIRQVVVIGKGVAGVTAIDYVQRRHAETEIHLGGRAGGIVDDRTRTATWTSTRSAKSPRTRACHRSLADGVEQTQMAGNLTGGDVS